MVGRIAITDSIWIRGSNRSAPIWWPKRLCQTTPCALAGPLGVAMYTGSDLPATFRGGAFIGEHGSWDRMPLNGYKVVFVPFSGGRPSGPAQDVVTGFLDANNHARGRPVGLAVDRNGGLLIADDVGNTVWRVSSLKPGSLPKPAT